MKAIETTGHLLSKRSLQLDEPIDVPLGEVRVIILVPEDISLKIGQKTSPEERKRIVATLDKVTELSLKEGPPLSNREHDKYLYGGDR